MNKIWTWLKKRWFKILVIFGAGAVIIHRMPKVIARIAQYLPEPRGWKKVPGRATLIDIKDGDEYVRVHLPVGVIIDDVTAAGMDDGEWSVEVKHAKTDRRGDPDIGRGSSLGID